MIVDGINALPSVTEDRIVVTDEAASRPLDNPGICCGVDAEGVRRIYGSRKGRKGRMSLQDGMENRLPCGSADVHGDDEDCCSAKFHGFQEMPLFAGAVPVSDAELLIQILPRGAKSLARPLMAAFGTFAEVVTAPAHRLLEIAGVTADVVAVLKSIETAARRITAGEIKRKSPLSSWDAVLAYLRASMAFAEKEQFRVLFLDKTNQLIADEIHQTGTIDHVPVYVREVIKRSLELSATALILVHNHPSGDPTPSGADISMTKEIMNAGKVFGIVVHDHVIVARKGHASLKSNGLI
jgi:DNA repair protein RadC